MYKMLVVLWSLPSFSLIAQVPEPLVNIHDIDSTIQIELRYATPNNFTHQTIYTFTTGYVHKDMAHALYNVQQELKKYGLGLKIWDAFRPKAAQWKLWETVPDPRFVGDPRKGGRHTRGTAVDLTLIDLKTDKELEMPTEFDDFTKKAHPNYHDLPEHIKKNRTLLYSVMTKHGFTVFPNEWWHFDLKNWRNYPLLDISPDVLT